MSAQRDGSRESPSKARYFAVLAAVLFIALLGYGLTRGASQRVDDALQNGRAIAAPEFALQTLTTGEPSSPRLQRLIGDAGRDGVIALSELRGVPIVLNFWASWCGPCREEAPLLESAWQRADKQRILYLGLNMQDLTEDALEFTEEFSASYPAIRDPGREVSLAYGLTGIPETFFIDRRGRVVGHAVGVVTREILDQGEIAADTGSVVGLIRAGSQGATR